MENMFWGGEVLKLESVSLQEPKVIEWKETLRRAIQASLIPLKAYADGKRKSVSSLFLHLSFVFSLRTLCIVDESQYRSLHQVCRIDE